MAAALYLTLAVALWWNVWSVSPATVMTCECTDAGRMVWYLAWTPYALAHGHSLLFSTFLFHPGGLNLLNDTSVPAFGFLFSPVTVLFGPVVTMNVVSTLIPASTAYSMYWLLQRWVRWAPAAFVGGLAYGFSAWVVVQLTYGWINLACLALLPLMAACLDELLVRQQRRPIPVGLAFAALVAVEVFISIELALIAVLSLLIATVLLLVGAAVGRRAALRRRWRHAAVGLGASGAFATALLAYPVWFFLAGPAHLSGAVWTTNVPGELGNIVGNLWDPIGHWGPLSNASVTELARAGGGYQGPAWPSPSYLGWGLVVVLGAGVLIWWRDGRLWYFAALGGVTFALSLEVGPHRWGPWSILYHLPLLVGVVQYRFAAVVVLAAAVMLGIVLDRCHSAVLRRSSSVVPDAGPGRWISRSASALVMAAVAAVALVPTVRTFAPNLPAAMQSATLPRWFSSVAPHLPAGAVLATYPFATADSQASIPWQARGGMPFQMAGGGGPAGTPPRAGRYEAGFEILRDASNPTYPSPSLDAAHLASVREALHGWQVTTVVVPDNTGLHSYQTGRGEAYGIAFYTAVLGSPPTRQEGAWVWTQVDSLRTPPVSLLPSTEARCLNAGLPVTRGGDPWGACVLRNSPIGRSGS